MPGFNNRKHEISKLCFTVHTKASDISLYRKKNINLKKTQKNTYKAAQSKKKKKKKIYIPFNKVPGQQSALIRNQTSSELVKIMMFDWLH